MNIGIIGCGLIGRKRALQPGGHQVVALFDQVSDQALALAREIPNVEVCASREDLLARDDVDVVVIATPHNALAECVRSALHAGKHILVEKPGGRVTQELTEILDLSKQYPDLVIRVGFNHRFHPAFQKAREIWDSGVLGPMMMIRAQ